MLSEDEKRYLVEKLIEHVAGLEKPREALTANFIGTTFANELAAGTPRQMVLDGVRLCLADAWSHDPPWLVLLIEVIAVNVVDAKLRQIRDRASVRPPPPPNPMHVTVLDNGTPFVNRRPLRDQLSRLATAAAKLKPILVVTGNNKSGKSYSTEYIDHFSVHNGQPTLTCRVPLRAGAELETGPEEVAIELVRAMGRTLQDKPSPNTNQKLIIQQLASWVLSEAVRTAKQCWLILDNFEGNKLRSDTRDFVVSLADAITTGAFSEQCRLILTGFDRSVLTVNPGRVDHEKIGPLSNSEIEVSVDEIARRASVPLAVAPLVAFACGGLPNGEQRLREMNTRLRGLIMVVDQVREIRQLVRDFDAEEVVGEMLSGLPLGDGLIPEIEKRLEALHASAIELGP